MKSLSHARLAWLALAFLLISCDAERPGLHQPLSIERIFSSPSLSGPRWHQVAFSPDGQWLTYLQGKRENHRQLDLWGQSVNADEPQLLVDSEALLKMLGEVELSEVEKARRERLRIATSGIVQYAWSESSKALLIPFQGEVFLWQLGDQKLQRLTKAGEGCEDPQLSPMGDTLACVSQANLLLIDLKTARRTALTKDGTPDNPIGLAEFIAQEEIGRYRGYWWSPQGDQIAYTRVFQTKVDELDRYELYPQGLKVLKQKYPAAGRPNADVELWVHNLKTGKRSLVFKTGSPAEEYLTHVQWLTKAETGGLIFQVQSRDQKQTQLRLFNPVNQKNELVLTETDPAWVNLFHEWRESFDGQKLYWLSEQSGSTHVHELDLKSKTQRQVTSGPWNVGQILRVDEQHLYLTANSITPLEQHLSRVSLNGKGDLEVLLSEPGTHQPILPRQGEFFVDLFSRLESPLEVRLHHLSGKRKRVLLKNAIEGSHPLVSYRSEFGAWQNHSVITPDGELFYRLLLPPLFDPKKKYPVIQHVYGGPGQQVVRNIWGNEAKLFQQVLVQNQFIILEADNRGTPGRGRNFEREIHHGFAKVEVEDQSNVLKHALRRFPYLDRQRVGVYGHSYGGYLTLQLLAQHPELYKVGVAGAPVVDWKLYDTHYTERYLGTPEENPSLYERASVLNQLEDLRGRLLVIHGMADDNVLFTHSTTLFSALQGQGKVFDMMTYPGSKHGIRESEAIQIHHHRTILDHFKRHL